MADHINTTDYLIASPEDIASPRLLVFRERVERNIAHARGHLRRIVARAGEREGESGHIRDDVFSCFRPHVKTHKSSWIARLQLEAGITRYKATPNELDMLVAAGAPDVLVSYPLTPHDADDLCRRVAAHPEVRFSAQVAAPRHVADLVAAATRHGVRELDCYIDVDVGMHRTGVAPDGVPDLHRVLAGAAPTLRFAGIHAYDGHNKGRNDGERRAAAEEAMAPVIGLVRDFEHAGVSVPVVVAGGTPGFLPDLAILHEALPPTTRVEVSPGTWIFWDSNYDARMPGLFEIAALVFARVMDRPGPDLVTLDLGYKRWAIDAGPIDVFSRPGLEVVGTSEEHTVLRVPAGDESSAQDGLEIGDWVLMAPRHVCPTVNLWEWFTVIGPDGRIEIERCPVDGRNR